MIFKTWMLNILCVIALFAAITLPAEAGKIRLLSSAEVESSSVRLADVAEIVGKDAFAFADTKVAAFVNDSKTVSVSLDSIRKTLTQKKANWATLTLIGFDRCAVNKTAMAGSESTAQQFKGFQSNVKKLVIDKSATEQAAIVYAPNTLASLIQNNIARKLNTSPSNIRLEFKQKDNALLTKKVDLKSYYISPVGKNLLGRVAFVINQQQGKKLQNIARIYAKAEMRSYALFANENIQRNTQITDGSIEMRQIWLDSSYKTPLNTIKHALGQIAKRNIKQGAMICSSDLKQPVLVNRNDIVSVHCISGMISIEISAVALESGKRNDLIQLKNIDSNKKFTAKVIGSALCEIRRDRDTVLRERSTSQNSSKLVLRGGQ